MTNDDAGAKPEAPAKECHDSVIPGTLLTNGEYYCTVCGTGTDDPMFSQGLPFAHTHDCDWLISNVEEVDDWRSTPGANRRPGRGSRKA
jgi:hypothetical protein